MGTTSESESSLLSSSSDSICVVLVLILHMANGTLSVNVQLSCAGLDEPWVESQLHVLCGTTCEHVRFFADHITQDLLECARHPRPLASALQDDETRRMSNGLDALRSKLEGVEYPRYQSLHRTLLGLPRRKHQIRQSPELQTRIDCSLKSPARVRRHWGWRPQRGLIRCRTEHHRL